MTPPTTSAILHERAMTAWSGGRPDEALDLLRRAVREAVDLEVLNDLAVATAELVDTRAGMEVLSTVLAIDPAHAEARDNLAALAGREQLPAHGGLLSVESLLAGSLGRGLSARVLGQLLGAPWPGTEPALHARLTELPSATTVAERWFFRNMAAIVWRGENDVFENGPLLGGTTRAIALGMLANPARQDAARLDTHDWFNSAIGLDVDDASFERMIQQGLLRRETRQQQLASHSFRGVFEELHAGHDYSDLLRIHTAALPGSPAEVDTMANVYRQRADARYDLVFVDGCKSWYGTRWFLEQVAPTVVPGGYVVMQDYGWYTCFWLSAVVGCLPGHFRLAAHVDHTYAFEVLRPITPEDVKAFPETPDELGASGFEQLYGALLVDAWDDDDSWRLVSLSLQHAAALATIGHRSEARERIRALADRLELRPIRGAAHQGRSGAGAMVLKALRSPTYRSDSSEIML
jgi:hypothetical protein